MPSIRQNTFSDLLPDFRNLAVIARVLVAVNALALIAALYAAPSLRAALERFVEDAAFLEPLLFIEVAVLFALSRQLGRLSYPIGCTLVIALAAALAALYQAALSSLQLPNAMARSALFAALLAAVLLGYFQLLVKAYSPALAEARLQALQSRIRPHFLFNSLNAVLALIRRDPKRAERTLEDLADLFRSLVSDTRRFVRLSEEIALLERYAAIEHCASASGCASPGSSTPRLPTRCSRRWCCSRCSRTPSTTASSRRPNRARCWCASSGAATASSRASRTR
jgi:two-component system sensor histidine kinase AlgZ